MTEFPFLDRIPIDRRMTIINDLSTYQQERHGCELEICTAIKNKQWPIKPKVIIDAPQYQEKNIDDINKEMSGNSDIKVKME